MKTRHGHRYLELGRFWFLLPMLGALTALILLTAWPELFSEPPWTQADAPMSVAAS